MVDLQPLWEALRDPDPETSLNAGKNLVAGGADVEQVIPAMINALQRTPVESSDLSPFFTFPIYTTFAFFDFMKPAVRAMAVRTLDQEIPAEQRINLIRFISCSYGDWDIALPFFQRLVETPDEDATLRAWAEFVLHSQNKHDFELTENAIEFADREDIEMPLRVKALDCLSRAKRDDTKANRFKEILFASLASEQETVVKMAGNSLARFQLHADDWPRVYTALDGKFGYALLGVLQNQPEPPAAMTASVMRWLSRDWENENEHAQIVLARIGTPAVQPCLVLAADVSASYNSRSGALWTLWRMETLDDSARRQLGHLVESEDHAISSQAAAVLAHFGDTSDETLAALMEAFEDNESQPHCALAKKVIRKLPTEKVVPFMITKYEQLVDREEPKLASELMHFLMKVGSNSEAACRFITQRLREATGYYDGNMVQNAISCVEYPIVPLLIESLHDAAKSGDDAQVARLLEGMAWRLYIDPDVKQFIEPVTPFLDSDNAEVAAKAEELLAQFPSTPSYQRRYEREQRESKERIAAIRKQLQETILAEAEVEESTISQLRAVKDTSDEAVAYLVRCLSTRITYDIALRALEELGEEGWPTAVKMLRSMIDGPYQLDVLKALGRLGPPARVAAPEIARLLTSDESSVLIATLDALAGIGSDDTDTCARVLELSHYTDSKVTWAALKALGGCQSSAGNARLLTATLSSDKAYRLIAALAKTRPFPEEGYAVLEREIESTKGVQHMVETAVINLGDAGLRLLPKLIESLPLHHQTVTCDDFGKTASSIASFGTAAKSAVPHLESFLRGRHHSQAANAIWRISPARAEELNLPNIYVRK